MKKFFAGIAAAAIITVPMTSFALESMSKGALKKATGQAGVSIALDDIVIYQKSNPTTIYWDADGVTTYQISNPAGDTVTSSVGGIGKTGVEISYAADSEKVIVLDGILDNSDYGVAKLSQITGRLDIGIAASGQLIQTRAADGSATGIVQGYDPSNGQISSENDADVLLAAPAAAGSAAVVGKAGYLNSISPLTIDVGTCESLTRGLAWNIGEGAAATANNWSSMTKRVTGVVIGLPTIEIQTYHKNNTQSIKIANTTAPTGVTIANNGTASESRRELIQIEKSGHSTMAILGGRLEIAPH